MLHNVSLFFLLLCIWLQQEVNCFVHHNSPPDSVFLRFTYEATDFSPAKAYDYIIIGGGTAGCPLAATLSESYSVLLLERGSSLNKSVLYESNIFQNLLAANDNDSPVQTFVSEDGLQNARARILGGGSMINGGFYSRADDYFYDNAGIEWDMGAVERAYEWVENSIVTRPARLNRFQTSFFNGLLESGVVPDNGFTFDHVRGTKIGGSTFNDSGIRHGAVELLNNANPENLDVLVHAMVDRVIFSTSDSLANFKELAPPSAESERRIKEIYKLPEGERTFNLLLTSSSQRSSSNMSVPVINLEGFQLDELDSYSSLVPAEQEPKPKPSTTPKPSTSKTTTASKAPPASRTRASSSRKRKEMDSPTASETFSLEHHGFSEATSFLKQGLECLMHLYEDACGLNKMLQIKLEKAEATIADQGTIAAAKSQHYEDKYKAMAQENQAALHKANEDAQAKLDAALIQYQQNMSSYRDSLKASVVVSLLQARIRMAYEARDLGFECPSWNIKTWEAKLQDLGGHPVAHPAKHAGEEPSKAAEEVANAGDDAEKDPEADAGANAGKEVADQEGAAS